MKKPDAEQRFVVPFYLEMLHGNCLALGRDAQLDWLTALRVAASEIDRATTDAFLRSGEWRRRLAAAWFVAINGWEEFVPSISDLLVASERTYCGQGFCVALAGIGTDDSVSALEAYLQEWLSRLDCQYDQPWAIAALAHCDRARGENRSSEFVESCAVWSSTISRGRATTAAPVSEILQLIGIG